MRSHRFVAVMKRARDYTDLSLPQPNRRSALWSRIVRMPLKRGGLSLLSAFYSLLGRLLALRRARDPVRLHAGRRAGELDADEEQWERPVQGAR